MGPSLNSQDKNSETARKKEEVRLVSEINGLESWLAKKCTANVECCVCVCMCSVFGAINHRQSIRRHLILHYQCAKNERDSLRLGKINVAAVQTKAGKQAFHPKDSVMRGDTYTHTHIQPHSHGNAAASL